MNRKSSVKKLIYFLFLFIFICVESFAISITDIDKSAFITKAEFDSLKNVFQSQIDAYSAKVESQIDNAIASYLSGIKVETTEELDSYLNKINNLCEDFRIVDGAKVKYGYRCMAGRFATPTTQKPIGAITNFFISRSDIQNMSSHCWARFGLTYNTRTSFNNVQIPTNTYQIGKYFIVDENTDGNLFPKNEVNDVTYRFYTGGSSFTFGVNNNITTSSTGVGTLTTTSDFKNEDEFWSIKVGQAKYVYHNQASEHTYDSWRCAYGTSFDISKNYITMPICGETNSNMVVLRAKNLVKMGLQEQAYTWNLFYTIRAILNYGGTNSKTIDKAASTGASNPDRETTDSSFPWTFYFNCHPYETANTRDFIDEIATGLLGRTVYITDGIPVFKAPREGIVNMKITFVSPDGAPTCYAALKKTAFPNSYSDYTSDSNLKLRDIDNVRYTSNVFNTNQEYHIRMDVDKNDIIYLKAASGSNQYGLVGASTTQIKISTKEE